ncbi:MAG: bifunctional demethylmenaquinone methyltransferase/2-methoxy-6-polyprenyl-1,4-benzoquinol methylase UbiE [Planctomycetes bacterium HGW-Planctomycetes-2]|nr:MAG: bifunctional demethylmenaquinone methyltransferase/2-methoxy-6-polyprenyl-1,4-benzoquinol methylase UbiE [Planctomycetes bacterium HGW-Planctomycetes-2]
MAAPRTDEPTPAWTARDLEADPHAQADKAERVRLMFGAIAHRYDLNNRLHSFGRDQAWRRAAVRMAGLRGSEAVLDVACGTGDLTRAFADAGAAEVTGLDFTPQMLRIARTRRLSARQARAAAPALIRYVEGDAMRLDFPDRSFDVVSIAFGIRNVADPARAMREFRRVLRPGGRLVILEFSRPGFAPARWANDFYCKIIMPHTATFLSGDRSGAYHYLPRSIDTFFTRRAMLEAITDAGFTRLAHRALTLGVCVCYRGEAPAP